MSGVFYGLELTCKSGLNGHSPTSHAGRRRPLVRRAYEIPEYSYHGLLVDRQRKDITPSPPPYHSGAGGVENMNDLENECCLRMARSLDAEAARTRGDSYLRKLVEEQAAKYRAHAANNSGPVREQPNRDELI
jgi:hypothetical protein